MQPSSPNPSSLKQPEAPGQPADRQPRPSPRLEYLDSVRGLAAWFVLLSHIIPAFAWPASYLGYLEYPFIGILCSGKPAVAMFFVLSGFVLAKPFTGSGKDFARRIHLPSFYLRRFTRIWIPWFFAFLASLGVKHYFYDRLASVPHRQAPG